jgi:broad specificity phosphatase PhoE
MEESLNHWVETASGDIAFVSHQDPVHAVYRRISGDDRSRFHESKPAHCAVTTLQRTTNGWSGLGRWEPEQ